MEVLTTRDAPSVLSILAMRRPLDVLMMRARSEQMCQVSLEGARLQLRHRQVPSARPLSRKGRGGPSDPDLVGLRSKTSQD
ncbi:MAG: hypothetical protein DMG24_09840 [Acidobacteria bacterium]|nr:MAG: hypothetical protein DMG24_09840 [Acidobacteriota bacterium]